MIKKLLFFFAAGFFILSSCVVIAQEPPVAATSFEGAKDFGQVVYTIGDIKKGETRYMKISVQPGKRLDVAINVSRNDMATVEAVIYDENRKQLNRLNEDTDETQFMLFYVPGNVGQGVRPYYVSVKNTSTYRDIVKNVSVNLSLADVSDAQSGIDAGEDFTNALVIQPGAYKGFLAGSAGSDHKDFYRVSVKRGQELSVKVTPVSDAAYFINIYDVNRKEIKQVFPENPGQILTASWFTPSDQDAYILIVRSEGGSRNYDFEIAVSQAKPGVEKEQTKKQEQKILPPGEEGRDEGKDGSGWWIKILVVIIAITLVGVWYMKKKQTK